MRKLSTEKRATILAALTEGNSVASVVRMLGVNKRTVLRLMVDAASMAETYHDRLVHGLQTKRVQVDEQWSFVHSKQRNVKPEHFDSRGDSWVWVAVDADSKVVIDWHVGDRDTRNARVFMKGVASRFSNRVQMTSDGFGSYAVAVPASFGAGIDFAQMVKIYGNNSATGPSRRYSPPACIGAKKRPMIGCPRVQHISTSFVERVNLTTRMHNRRFTRLTNAHSKTNDNHKAAIALHFFAYNFIRKHQTIKTTPAVVAGVACQEWTWLEFVQLMEKEEKRIGGRLTDYQPAQSKKPAAIS